MNALALFMWYRSGQILQPKGWRSGCWKLPEGSPLQMQERGRGGPFAPAWDPCREGFLSFPGPLEGCCRLQSQSGGIRLNVNT